MDEMYEYAYKVLMSPENLIHHHQYYYNSDEFMVFNSPIEEKSSSSDDDDVMTMKAKIATHPCYPKLLDAYIDCQKVGAPPEMACLLEEIRSRSKLQDGAVSTCIGQDPHLDHFMVAYNEVLVKYKSDLSRPFDEATSFLNNIHTQLLNLSNDDVALSSEEEDEDDELSLSRGEIEIQDLKSHRELKDKLLGMYGNHIASLKLEFSKKRKKGKLPKEARQTLLEWWNLHSKWPYPTEADKIALSETTGLDQKQINNWFINQRKRHWKSPENMHLGALMEQY